VPVFLPLAGFYAKLLVLYSLLTIENGIIALLIIIFSAVSAANYLSLVKLAFFDLPNANVFVCPITVSYLISLLSFIIIIAII
jgi:NADH:ubiquinone oxidoreductase subunit 2 (subunit N)